MCVLLFRIKRIVHGSLSSSFKIETNLALRPSKNSFRETARNRIECSLRDHDEELQK